MLFLSVMIVSEKWIMFRKIGDRVRRLMKIVVLKKFSIKNNKR